MIEQISNKTYFELSKEEETFLKELIIKHNLSLEQRNMIYISFLFGNTIKESMDKLKDI